MVSFLFQIIDTKIQETQKQMKFSCIAFIRILKASEYAVVLGIFPFSKILEINAF